MIRDYKSGSAPKFRHRSHGLILVSAAFLGGVAYAVHRVDLPSLELSEAEPVGSTKITSTLPIPPKQPVISVQQATGAEDRAVSRGSSDDDVWTDAPVASRKGALPSVSNLLPLLRKSTTAETKTTERKPVGHKEHSADPAPVTAAYSSANGKQPEAGSQPATPATSNQPDATWTEYVIQRGDTLAAIFREFGYSPTLLYQITNSGTEAKQLASIRPGQTLRLRRDAENNLLELIFVRNKITSLQILHEDGGFTATELRKDVETQVASVGGTIADSLFVDGQAAGMSDSKIMELAKIFRWDIDFALEIRAGDRFSVIYEERFADGERLADGPILAAEFVNRGTTYRAVRFVDKDGIAAYYDPDGKLKQRAFTRTPVEFARISSKFTNRRWHPVLKKWRSHKGVDYAAPTGTPVKATGAGRVSFVGRKGGYGKVVFIRHGDSYTTVYGHLSRFKKGLKVGTKIKQGEVIGRVGQSGLASGPHLHYEFRVGGQHRNPLTIKLPSAIALNKAQMPTFKRDVAPLLAQLETAARKTMVASAFPNES